jgi:hypothetical protein
LAAAGWVASRGRGEALRRTGNHALLVAVAASLPPNGMMLLFNQTRPGRKTVAGHVHGIVLRQARGRFSVGPRAAHGLALASAAGGLPAVLRRAIRAFGVGVSLTRVLILAHWASDLVAGFVLGAILERTLRLWTGYPLRRPASTLAALKIRGKREMTEYVVRFLVGGIVVSAFSMLGDVLPTVDGFNRNRTMALLRPGGIAKL